MPPALHSQCGFTLLWPEHWCPTLIEKLRWWGSSSCVTLRWDFQEATVAGNASVLTGQEKKGNCVVYPPCGDYLEPLRCLTESCWTEEILSNSEKWWFKKKFCKTPFSISLTAFRLQERLLGVFCLYFEPWCGMWKPSHCWFVPGWSVCRGTCAELLLSVNRSNRNFLLWVVVWYGAETRALKPWILPGFCLSFVGIRSWKALKIM